MASFTKDDETTFLRDMTQLVYEKVDAAAAWRLAMKPLHGDLHLVPVHAASITTQPHNQLTITSTLLVRPAAQAGFSFHQAYLSN